MRLDKTDAEAALALARAYEGLDRPTDAALAYARLLDQPRGPGPRAAEALPEADRADAWRRYARKAVRDRFGVELRDEVVYLGRF